VVAVSTQLDRELAAAGIDRRVLIENGISLDPPRDPACRDRLRASLGVPPDGHLVLSVGRLDAWKGYDLLLDAFASCAAELPTARLLIAGDGDLRDDLAARSRRLGIESRVTLPGYREDVPAILAAADLFVISSRKEGLPMVLLEAMAAGLAVVATAVGEIPKVLGEGAGSVVPPGDAEALAAEIARLLQSPELRRQFAETARDKFLVQYSREAMGARYQRMYEHLLSNAVYNGVH
jgi:glycosyltransferase involved in cell wall biosynthesis